MTCGRCSVVAYCGTECQVKDFPSHAPVCNPTHPLAKQAKTLTTILASLSIRSIELVFPRQMVYVVQLSSDSSWTYEVGMKGTVYYQKVVFDPKLAMIKQQLDLNLQCSLENVRIPVFISHPLAPLAIAFVEYNTILSAIKK